MFASSSRFRSHSFIKGCAAVVAAALFSVGVTVSTAHAATPATNPPLLGGCGQNVAIVVDLSSSMDPSGARGRAPDPTSSLVQLKAAATEYVETLKGSNARIALYTFGTSAPNIGNTSRNSQNNYTIANANHPLTSIQTEAGAQQVEAWINGWQVYGFTRWDLGLQQVANSSDHYDFVLFITDGYPTNDRGDTITDQSDIIAAANNVKAKGTRIIAVFAPSGTGAAVNNVQISNLEAISGTVTGDPSVLLNDYYVTDWSNMVDQFQALANLCASTNTGEATRTIHYVNVDGTVMAPDVVQTVSYTKTTDLSSGEVTYTPENPSYQPVESPAIAGYTPDQSTVGFVAVPVTADSGDLEVTVVYTPDTQRVVVTLVDDDTNGSVVPAKAGAKVEVTGPTGTAVGFTEADARNTVPDGYDYVRVVNVDFFDSDDTAVQTIIVHVRHHISSASMTTTRTITYVGAGARTPAAVVQQLTWTVSTDDASDITTYSPQGSGYPVVTSPVVTGYQPDKQTVNARLVSTLTTAPQNETVTVTYVGVPQTVNVVFVDDELGRSVTPKTGATTTVRGIADEWIGYADVDALVGVPAGYEYVFMDLDGVRLDVDTPRYFDDDPDVDQVITVHLTHQMAQSTMSTTRTITFEGAGARTPDDVVQPVTWTVTTDGVTGVSTYATDDAGYAAVPIPAVNGYISRIGQDSVQMVPVLPVASSMVTVPQDVVVSVSYVPSVQKATVVYIDDVTGQRVPALTPIQVSGPSGSSVVVSQDTVIPGVPSGYDYVPGDVSVVFDFDDAVDQEVLVHLTHQMAQSTMSTTRTITFEGAGAVTPADVVQPVQWTVTTDMVTKEIVYTTDDKGYPAVTSPAVDGYTAQLDLTPTLSVPASSTDKPQSITVEVAYSPVVVVVQTGGHVVRAHTVTSVTSTLLWGLAVLNNWRHLAS